MHQDTDPAFFDWTGLPNEHSHPHPGDLWHPASHNLCHLGYLDDPDRHSSHFTADIIFDALDVTQKGKSG